jgi:hypothetical protein
MGDKSYASGSSLNIGSPISSESNPVVLVIAVNEKTSSTCAELPAFSTWK